MRKYLCILATLLAAAILSAPARAQAHIKVIKIAVTNPSDVKRDAEDIVLSIPALKKIALPIFPMRHLERQFLKKWPR